ncbi:MAG: hypothetical protein ACI4O7_10695 [Aristaeellaceae bacterium]
MRTILMIDTGRAAMRGAAQEFAAMGDRVVILAREAFELPGAQVRAANLLDAQSLRALTADLGTVDILILGVPPMTGDGPIGAGHDTDAMLEELTYMGQGIANVVEACLPAMEGGMKRIACITERESSISRAREEGDMARHMALAGLNLMGRELFNRLRKEGFTFRWYAAEDAAAPMSAAAYILARLSWHPDEPPCHNDEDRLVMRDGFLREIPW